jgi:hypothetical protein
MTARYGGPFSTLKETPLFVLVMGVFSFYWFSAAR